MSEGGGLHWKSKIRSAHTKLLSRGEKGGEKKDFVELWENIASKNIPLWYLQLLGGPEKEGWLIKKGGIGGALTKRWFVLVGPLLFYFSSEQSDSRAKGVVPLSGAEMLEYTVPEKELQKYEKKAQKGGLKLGYCWAIQTRVREFVISCDTKEARDEWIAASFANSELVIEETHDNPLQSIATLRKLLLPPEQMRKELESAADSAGPTAGKTPLVIPPLSLLSASSPLSSPASSPREELVTGALLGAAWRFDAESGVLSAYDVRTDGSWPFADEEEGLHVACRYSWTGSKLRSTNGSASRGDWDGKTFKWSCSSSNGSFRSLYSYVWVENTRRFEPSNNSNLPVWHMTPTALKNFNFTNVKEFTDLSIEYGTVPLPVALAVAMHKWQWKQEGLGWE